MKNGLLAGTALAVVGLMAAGEAAASEKIKLELGGFSRWWVVGAWSDNAYQAGIGSAVNNADVKGDNEIHFKGTTQLDNGLKVGIQVELEAGGHTDQTSDAIDASFVFVEGGFGRAILGSTANGAVLLHVTAPDAAGNGVEGLLADSKVIAQPSAVTSLGHSAGLQRKNSTNLNTDDKAEKLTYLSPAFGGMTVAASYIPEIDSEDTRTQGSGNTQAWALGTLYSTAVGGATIKASAGALVYDGSAGDALDGEWSVGAQLGYGGFTVGGSFRNVLQNQKGATTNTSVTNATTSSAGRGWDAGIQYATGPYSVSLYYFESRTEGVINTGGIPDGEDAVQVWQVSAKYTLGPGVDLLGTAGWASFQDGDRISPANANANSNEGWAVMSGLALTF